MRKYIVPFIIIDLDYTSIPDQSDEHTSRGCEVECVVNLDEIIEKGDSAIIEKRIFDKSLILKSDSREYDIGCLHIEKNFDCGPFYGCNPSIDIQVLYSKEVYNMFIPIILNAYQDTSVYSTLVQRYRDEQIGKLLG